MKGFHVFEIFYTFEGGVKSFLIIRNISTPLQTIIVDNSLIKKII